MKAASRGFSNPKAAIPTPMLSTTSVPTKFCMMIPRQRRATRKVSTNLERSFPIKITSAALAGDVSSRSHGDSNIGLHQGGSVVDSVTDHGDIAPFAAQLGHPLCFLLRQQSSHRFVDSEIAANR